MVVVYFNQRTGAPHVVRWSKSFFGTSESRVQLTQSKSKTIITRSMLTISLIVFTDKLQGHVNTFYSK